MLSTNVLCLKKRKKKSYCIVNKEDGPTSTEKNKRSAGGAATMLQITEDTPPDMLAGAMDLTVHLPTGRSVKMSVERSTPMMDLLVHITTSYHLQLSGYTLQALGMAPSKEHSDTILPYKPNTPIGALDTQHIKVIPKARTVGVPKNVPPGHQPFESTFRLKVHLPRNQLFVTRVGQSVHLEDIMKKVCEEKNLDPIKYEFRHPANLDEILDPKLTLSDYTITEIYLVQKGTGSLNQAFSTGDIMVLRKEEERKQMHNKTGGGVFNLIFRRGKSSTGSLSSENRSISPTHSDDSRSVTPPAVQQIILPQPDPPTERPKPPQRKRRPAPKPPQDATKKTDTGLTICHSRNSSDSSGYHEASVLSDNCNTSLPRRPKSTMISEETQKPLSGLHSQSTSNLSKMSTQSKSTSSLALPSRKKKSAPPPPPAVLKAENSKTNLQEPSLVVASQPCIVAETESTASTSQQTPQDSLISDQSLPAKAIEETPVEPPKNDTPEAKETNEVQETNETESIKENDVDSDWQYQLPSPPKAFRDSSPVAFAEVNPESVITDSVVTCPELFEKLKVVKDQSEKETVSDITSTVSEEEKPILNKLSLENLEKRKSLVYNRELATSLKMREEEFKNDTFSSTLLNFEETYDEMKRSSPKKVISTSTLPNFKITTYNPKQKLDIFEDDTVRSSSKRNSFAEPLQKNFVGRSMENISFRKNSSGKNSDDEKSQDYKFYKPATQNVFRSESFSRESTWVPSKPVTRSKSQIALNKYKDTKNLSQMEDDNLTKSNSLFDVSGLQSLGVMRRIQNQLNTPNTSTEQLDGIEKPISYQEQPEVESEVQTTEIKTNHHYRPPSINMSTWSERPKIPVNVKEDPDYKFGVKNNNSSKLIVNTVNNDIKSHNSIEVRNKPITNTYTNGVSIKVNGVEPVSQNSGNVVIKIGGSNTTSNKPVFRKPLGNINTDNQRPHSIAFGREFDISRVPIVRSVEFKKPYKEFQTNNNTSITQIYSNNYKSSTWTRNNLNNPDPEPVKPSWTKNNLNNPKPEPIKSTTWVKNNLNNPEPVKSRIWARNDLNNPAPEPVKPQPEAKPVFRVNSFLQNSSAPIVRGFKGNNEANRMSWSQPHSFSTLPAKNFTVNPAVNTPLPFSQRNLRRTDSTNNVEKKVPPPAPVMPKVFNPGKQRDCGGDPKEQLLQAIRDFGGKKGLRAVKA